MRFVPKTEAECSNLLPEGVYAFEILEAEDTQSKAGNDMLKLKLGVDDGNGSQHGVMDYLVEAVAYKLRHLADATGLLKQYEQGEMKADLLVGRAGQCKLAIAPAKDGYDAKNVVKDYVKRGAKEVIEPKAVPVKGNTRARDDMDDEIPF